MIRFENCLDFLECYSILTLCFICHPPVLGDFDSKNCEKGVFIPRLGRQIPHFSAVDLQNIRAFFSSCKTYRYTLEMSYLPSEETRTQTVTVILKNPSSADEYKADSTIRRVETYVYRMIPSAAHLKILNVFALRATYAGDVHRTIKEHSLDKAIGHDNDSYIQRVCADSDWIIRAWGSHSQINKRQYDLRLAQVNAILAPFEKTLYEVQGIAKHYPQHGLYWSYDYPLKKVSFSM
jgi:hypothetical protein